MTPERSIVSSDLRRTIFGLECVTAVPAVIVMLFYVTQILQLPAEDWVAFGISVALMVLLSVPVVGIPRVRATRALLAYCDARDAGEVPGPVLEQGFAAVIEAPSLARRRMLLMWLSAVVGIGISMTLAGSDGWLFGDHILMLAVMGLSGGLVASTMLYFSVKQALDPLARELSLALADPEQRAALVSPLRLSAKMQQVVTGTGVALLLFTMTLGVLLNDRSHDERTLAWQARALVSLQEHMGSDGELPEALAELLPRRAMMPVPTSFSWAAAEQMPGRDLSFFEMLEARREREGSWHDRANHELVSVKRIAEGRYLMARTPRGEGIAGIGRTRLLQAISFLLAVAFLGAVSVVFARDLTRGLLRLGAEANRLASGDLRRGDPIESDDDIGELGRAFESMAGALRETVERFARVADRVENVSARISSMAGGVSDASAEQAQRIHQANDLVHRMNEQVVDVSQSAQALNLSVEESSSSILELGAAGDELNDTASVLSTKVDEVSSSIEQMVGSVKRVSNTSLELSDAAIETSSSMEEMASSMRAVDTTAEATAELSSRMLATSETGQGKVAQTIEGMHAIREATDAAEGVIRGLGARTQAIGAILDVIDDVADETNLLALNAAIIAAQAGEHGRSFSVVADEIKELADRVLVSTKEIGGLIRAVQEESDNAIVAIEAGSRSVAEGVDRSAEAGTSLEEITRNARESGERIAQIVNAVREQTRAAAHVVGLMDSVRGGVEAIGAAGAEQDRGNEVVFRSSVTMSEVAQQVRRTTGEQARGFNRIRESVENVREAVELINGALQEQTSACSQVAEFLEQVFEGSRSNEESAREMGGSTRDLLREAAALREDVAKFRI